MKLLVLDSLIWRALVHQNLGFAGESAGLDDGVALEDDFIAESDPGHHIFGDMITAASFWRFLLQRSEETVVAYRQPSDGRRHQLWSCTSLDGVLFDDDILEHRLAAQLVAVAAAGKRYLAGLGGPGRGTEPAGVAYDVAADGEAIDPGS